MGDASLLGQVGVRCARGLLLQALCEVLLCIRENEMQEYLGQP